MDNTKILKLNLSMSPRAIDELKQNSTVKCNSKYELPLIMFPDNKIFEITAAVSDGKTVCLGFVFDGQNIVLKGSLEHNNFFCTSVTGEAITDGRMLNLVFLQEKSEDFTYINDEVRQRIEMWYDYIESMQEKAEQNSYRFTCENAEIKNGKIIISTVDLKSFYEIRNLSVGFIDEKNQPPWGFGKVERFENSLLYVQPFGKDLSKVMSGLSFGTRLIVYDGAVDITCKRMKSGLDKLCRGESVNRRLPEFLFDPSKANRKIGDNITLTADNLLTKTMNPEQISAVEGVLNAEDLYLIQGPPGTGKTTVIAEICYQNAVRGLKTLIVSQSNLAVDNAISRVMNHADIRVLRKGDSSRVEEEGLPFVEDNVVRTWISQIAESTKKMDEDLTGRLAYLKESKERFSSLLELAENIKELEKNKNFHESQLYFFQNVLE
ncbi:MAG: AAA family ATPase, partial [Oscillospiraceae bacterium]|nr:AAA family ATPase [Oscillospiraceae bacterium]